VVTQVPLDADADAATDEIISDALLSWGTRFAVRATERYFVFGTTGSVWIPGGTTRTLAREAAGFVLAHSSQLTRIASTLVYINTS
jgi:photosystem II stability/assembly factor-like uncharacterized protein